MLKIVALLFIVTETILGILVDFLRKDFQWLILKYKDENPQIPSDKIERFLANGYDSYLGWSRKPNINGVEKVVSLGADEENKKETSYTMDERGSRSTLEFEEKPIKIATYGDSFGFCRHVNDNETWQYYLSGLTNTNVLNFSAGNWGFDQALLKIKKTHKQFNAKISIIAVVPETICRIQSTWKHYFEYGNVLAFKPRFIIENGELKLIENIINEPDKIAKYKEFLPYIKKYDYFYKKKFLKDLLSFPYCISIFKNPVRNFSLIFALILKKFGFFKNLAWEIILKENFKYCIKEYRRKGALDLLKALIRDFHHTAEEFDTIPIVVIMPYLNDLKLYQQNKSYYSNFVQEISKEFNVLDLTEDLIKEGQDNLSSLYNNDFYGGHLSAKGNEKAAHLIYKALLEKEFIK